MVSHADVVKFVDQINHPHFAGVVLQYWICSGDERIQSGDPAFAPASIGEEKLIELLCHGEGHNPYFSARAVFWHPAITAENC